MEKLFDPSIDHGRRNMISNYTSKLCGSRWIDALHCKVFLRDRSFVNVMG
jgi:hypothetical protein